MQVEVHNENDKMVTYVDTRIKPKVVDYSALCGKLDFIKKYECKTDAEKEAIDEAIELIEQKPRLGHWVKTPKAVMGEGYMWYCDNCEHQVYQDSSRNYPSENYCPNCGAKMVANADCISRQAVEEFVEYIQTIKDKHNDEGYPINYGTICDLVIRGHELV